MRIASTRDLGLYVRERRRRLGKTQTALAAAAQVSRRWLSDFEAGKATAELGLAMRTLHAAGLELDVQPAERGPDGIDLDDVLRDLGRIS